MALSNAEKQARWYAKHKAEVAERERRERAERALWRPPRRRAYDVTLWSDAAGPVLVCWEPGNGQLAAMQLAGKQLAPKKLLTGLDAETARGVAALLMDAYGLTIDRRHRGGRRGRPVIRSDGLRFASIRAAAAACGISAHRIGYALRTGCADSSGFRWLVDFKTQSDDP